MLSQFPLVMPQAVSAVLRVASCLRYIRDGQGDLMMRDLNELQDALRASKLTTLAALQEGAKAPQAAEAFMSSLGGPAALAEYYAAAMQIEDKASAWNNRLRDTLLALSAADLIGLVVRGEPGTETRHIEHKAFLPAAAADPLRASVELRDLLAAFEAVGA